ncbi:hypothetical protein NDU88_004969 [Pleurodeles waltl]|uniref:Uncharacterized protein n=1 Tax=Pleurodeles waltl TaxID=8319 RepID=A0AAV7T9M5_PLEWA|nr:hypothetical protein NDU88_004969 [Pleurodeles waltl]
MWPKPPQAAPACCRRRHRPPARRFYRRPGPSGAPHRPGRLVRSSGRPISPQLGPQSRVGGLGGGARTNTSTHATILAHAPNICVLYQM